VFDEWPDEDEDDDELLELLPLDPHELVNVLAWFIDDDCGGTTS
jgi:hypothetical protein